MIDRDDEADDLLALASGRHSFRLVGPRRYGKTTLLPRVLESAERQQMATVLVDLQGVLSIAEIVVRIEQRNPNVDAESVLLRLLELPTSLFERDGTISLIVFDEIQDVLAVAGADGKIRSVIQHQGDAATYAFAGSAPGVMQQLSADPKRPLLDQAVPRNLDPLPLADVGDYVAGRFRTTGRAAGPALTPLLEFTRGHPQRSMMLAHYLWERTPRPATADEGTWIAALDDAARDSPIRCLSSGSRTAA